MSSETLSQNEIDALLGGGRSAAAAPPPPVARVRPPDAQVYDFRRPHRVSKEKLRQLEAMYERFTKSLEGWLLGRVRGQVQLSLQSVEQFSFGEFQLSLPTPCSSYVFDVADSGGMQGVVDVGQEFAFFLVDRLFGGSGVPTILDRALTPIERMAVRFVAERVVSQVAEIWQDYLDLRLTLSGFESIPEILRAANREDPVLVANIEVTAASTRSLLLICLPFGVLEKFFAGSTERRVATPGTGEADASREITERSVRRTRVAISARLPEFRLSLRELSGLTEGTVLATGIPRTAPVRVHVGTQPRFEGSAGRVAGTLAIRVDERLATDGPTDTPTTRDVP